MNCPNCGLANPDNAKFCANCGTPFTAAPPSQGPYQRQPAYQSPLPPSGGNSILKNIGLGCLVAILIFFFLGISCTRGCFRSRRYYRRYGSIVRPVNPPAASSAVILVTEDWALHVTRPPL